MNKVSVIMPAYKENVDQFSKALASILNQTYRNLEIIIILDNPNNSELISYIKKIKDNRIKLIINETNLGITKTLNKGLSICSGKYIARMDSDDISEENRIEKQLNYLINNNLDLCGANVRWFNDKSIIKNVKYPSLTKNVKRQLLKRNCVAHPTFFAKKELFDNLEGYNEIPTAEDYDFLLRAVYRGYKVGNIPEYLLLYRINADGISRSNPGKQILISQYVKEYYKKNKSKSLTAKKIELYIDSKKYKRKIKRYNNFYEKIESLHKLKKENKLAYYITLAHTLIYLDLFIKKIYNTIYSKLLLINEEGRTKNEINKKDNT